MFGEQGFSKENLIQASKKRFYGKYRGIVTNVDDPKDMGRLRARVPALLGEKDTNWALPCVPLAGDGYGMQYIPNPGDGVWIEFEQGIVEKPIWTGFWWAREELPHNKLDEDFNHKKRYIWLPGDIYIETICIEDEEQLNIVHKKTGTKMMIKPDGEYEIHGKHDILIKDGEGNYMKFDYDEDSDEYKKFEIYFDGNTIELDKDSEEATLNIEYLLNILGAKEINIEGEEDLNVNIKGDTNINVEGDTNVNSNGDTNVDAGGNVDVNAGGEVDVSGTVIRLDGDIPVARQGDTVVVTVVIPSGSSAGTWVGEGQIMEGSNKVVSG